MQLNVLAAPPIVRVLVDNGRNVDLRALAGVHAPHLAVTVVDATRQAGTAFARNRGIERATTERLLFCDADDVVGVAEQQPLGGGAFDATVAGERGAGLPGRVDDGDGEVRRMHAGERSQVDVAPVVDKDADDRRRGEHVQLHGLARSPHGRG